MPEKKISESGSYQGFSQNFSLSFFVGERQGRRERKRGESAKERRGRGGKGEVSIQIRKTEEAAVTQDNPCVTKHGLGTGNRPSDRLRVILTFFLSTLQKCNNIREKVRSSLLFFSWSLMPKVIKNNFLSFLLFPALGLWH